MHQIDDLWILSLWIFLWKRGWIWLSTCMMLMHIHQDWTKIVQRMHWIIRYQKPHKLNKICTFDPKKHNWLLPVTHSPNPTKPNPLPNHNLVTIQPVMTFSCFALVNRVTSHRCSHVANNQLNLIFLYGTRSPPEHRVGIFLTSLSGSLKFDSMTINKESSKNHNYYNR